MGKNFSRKAINPPPDRALRPFIRLNVQSSVRQKDRPKTIQKESGEDGTCNGLRPRGKLVKEGDVKCIENEAIMYVMKI